MKKNESATQPANDGKKKLVLRRQSIGALDNEDLTQVDGGGVVPPDGGSGPSPTVLA